MSKTQSQSNKNMLSFVKSMEVDSRGTHMYFRYVKILCKGLCITWHGLVDLPTLDVRALAAAVPAPDDLKLSSHHVKVPTLWAHAGIEVTFLMDTL